MDFTIEPAVHDTFTLRRHYRQPPARVYAALADPAARRRWFAEGPGHDVETYSLDFRVGGAEKARYRMHPGTPIAGAQLSSDGVVLDIVPARRIVIAASMSLNGRCFSASLTTFETAAADDGGTQLVFTHHGSFFEGSDGPRMRRDGWEKLLGRLADSLTE